MSEEAQETFTVVLAKSGLELEVGRRESIMEVIRRAGVDVISSCEQGICGACETRVLEGVPDHFDAVLSREDRASGKTMMICCSGSKTKRLVLDL
ncbi:MAG: 2Fe-2S iron-sulfur cluster binding domain-containing protein [Hyphomonadaceae bacterium]|nr:2Fe-2S iron-sulfur cluster binding domain-containing protein [Hyphomonadaceae bacterium]